MGFLNRWIYTLTGRVNYKRCSIEDLRWMQKMALLNRVAFYRAATQHEFGPGECPGMTIDAVIARRFFDDVIKLEAAISEKTGRSPTPTITLYALTPEDVIEKHFNNY